MESPPPTNQANSVDDLLDFLGDIPPSTVNDSSHSSINTTATQSQPTLSNVDLFDSLSDFSIIPNTETQDVPAAPDILLDLSSNEKTLYDNTNSLTTSTFEVIRDEDIFGIGTTPETNKSELESFEIIDPSISSKMEDAAIEPIESGDINGDDKKNNVEILINTSTTSGDIDQQEINFDVLVLPSTSDLGLNAEHFKGQIAKKGSYALRRKPSRKGVRTLLENNEDNLYTDSTDPKPEVISPEDDEPPEKTSKAGVEEITLSHKTPPKMGFAMPGLKDLNKSKLFSKNRKESGSEDELSPTSENRKDVGKQCDTTDIKDTKPSGVRVLPTLPTSGEKPKLNKTGIRVLPVVQKSEDKPKTSSIVKEENIKNIQTSSVQDKISDRMFGDTIEKREGGVGEVEAKMIDVKNDPITTSEIKTKPALAKPQVVKCEKPPILSKPNRLSFSKKEESLSATNKILPITRKEEPLRTKLSDASTKKAEPLHTKLSESSMKKEDPLPTKFSEPSTKKEDPLPTKFSEPSTKKEEPLPTIFSEPSTKKEEPLLTKFSEPSMKKEEPLLNKFSEPSTKKEEPLPTKFSEPSTKKEELLPTKFSEPSTKKEEPIRKYSELSTHKDELLSTANKSEQIPQKEESLSPKYKHNSNIEHQSPSDLFESEVNAKNNSVTKTNLHELLKKDQDETSMKDITVNKVDSKSDFKLKDNVTSDIPQQKYVSSAKENKTDNSDDLFESKVVLRKKTESTNSISSEQKSVSSSKDDTGDNDLFNSKVVLRKKPESSINISKRHSTNLDFLSSPGEKSDKMAKIQEKRVSRNFDSPSTDTTKEPSWLTEMRSKKNNPVYNNNAINKNGSLTPSEKSNTIDDVAKQPSWMTEIKARKTNRVKDSDNSKNIIPEQKPEKPEWMKTALQKQSKVVDKLQSKETKNHANGDVKEKSSPLPEVVLKKPVENKNKPNQREIGGKENGEAKDKSTPPWFTQLRKTTRTSPARDLPHKDSNIEPEFKRKAEEKRARLIKSGFIDH